MRNNRLIRLTESDLHNIVKRSVNKILKENHRMIRESYFDPDWEYEGQYEILTPEEREEAVQECADMYYKNMITSDPEINDIDDVDWNIVLDDADYVAEKYGIRIKEAESIIRDATYKALEMVENERMR